MADYSNEEIYKVFVKFPKNVTWKDLYQCFNANIGKVRKIVVPRDDKKPDTHRGYAFITFKDLESYEKALSSSLSIGEELLVVKKTTTTGDSKAENRSAKRQLREKIDPKYVVNMSNVNHKSKMKAIIRAAEDFGDIASVYLPLRRNAVHNIGRGKLTFKNIQSASKAIEAGKMIVDETEIKLWRKKSVDLPQKEIVGDKEETEMPKSQNNKETNLDNVILPNEIFVGNLKLEWKYNVVFDYFKKFGRIVSLDLPWWENYQINGGYARILFDNPQSVLNALKEDNYIKKWKVEVVGRTELLDEERKEVLEKKLKRVEKKRERRKRKRMEMERENEAEKAENLALTGLESGNFEILSLGSDNWACVE